MSENSHSMHSTIHNFCSAPRRWLPLNWLLVLPLLAASAQFLAAAPARANPPGEAAAAAELPFALYITTSMKDVDEAVAVEQASVLENHRAILKCTALNPGKTYRTVWSLKDAGGHELVTRPELGFTATDSHQWVPNIYFRPDRLPQDGQWTWRVTVEGQGTFSKQITILPPTKDEAETLASFQQVRENVLHAFSLSWRFYDGCYFTVVDAGSPDETLLQVTNLLAPHFTPERVSPADKLNGFSYRSKATFGFEVWRQFTSAGGWTEWQNTKEHDSDLSEAYAHFLTANVPESFKTNFNLGFAAYIKDGHCRLLADDGTEFVDRRQNSNAKRFAKCPSKPFVQKALREGGSLRKSEQAAVETLRARPETTVDGSKETTDAIRALMGPGSSFLWQNNVPAPSFPR